MNYHLSATVPKRHLTGQVH